MELQNIEWYSDKELSIFFSKMPHVCMRYVAPFMQTEEVNSIKKYPFTCKEELKVAIFDHIKKQCYKFTIPKGYCYDGASIPRIFWRLIGANTNNSFLIPALIHDVLCEHHEYINNDRAFSTKVFNALLKAGKVNPVKRCFMKNSVAMFQTLFCNWKKGG